MTALGLIASKRLAGVPTYHPGKASPGPATGKLSANESVLGPGPLVRRAIADAAEGVGGYPDEARLCRRLAQAIAIEESHILLSNGSDEICFLAATVFLGPGRTAVVGDPCYAIDATVTMISGAELVRIALVEGGHNLEAMAAAAVDSQVVWLPSPHNPTGVAVTPSDLDAFLEQVPETCLVVLDEAYRDFADQNLQTDTKRLLERFPNLLIQRTLSKSWSMAGLRLGYALGTPDVVSALRRVRAPFSVNAVALAAGNAALDEPAWQEMTISRAREGRTVLEEVFTRLGVEYYPSQTNFVTAKVPYDLIAPALASLGISVRAGEDLGMPGWTRFTIGWAPTMTALRETLRDVLDRRPS
jgi:histidinol-phosphate aminotransferase